MVPAHGLGIPEMTFAEQLAALRATRESKHEEMKAVAQTSVDEKRSMDTAEAEQFDTLESEIVRLDADIARLSKLAAMDRKTAAPVADEADANANAGTVPVQVRNTQKLDPGIAFARAARVVALRELGYGADVMELAEATYPGQEAIARAARALVTKTAVAPAVTSNTNWAGSLVGSETSVFADFVEFLRPQTIIGKFGANGVPSLRNVPFRVPLIGQTSGGSGYWVGEASPKPLTKLDFERKTLAPLKVANIAVASMEVIRDSSPSADAIIRDSLAAALRERMDEDFIDPSKPAVSGVSPASITNSAPNTSSAGTDADAVREDIGALFGMFIGANNAPTSGVWIMPATTALSLSLMQNPLGQTEFPGLSMNGGTLFGLPVITSQYVPVATAGALVALVNASDIYIGDEGGVSISMSREASLEMSDDPSSPVTASTVLVSLWQHNLVGFLAERTIDWMRRRSVAVAYLTGVKWGEA